MRHLIVHDLGAATAKAAMERAFTEYAARYASYEPHLTWKTPCVAEVFFRARGFRLTGTATVDDHQLILEINVPLLLRPFLRRATQVIDREVGRWLERERQRGGSAP